MPRVKYTYDGSVGTETTANFTAGEETAQDTLDATNQSNYASLGKTEINLMGEKKRNLMEVI